MKKLLFVYIPSFIVAFMLLTVFVLDQMNMLNKKGINEALDFVTSHTIAETYGIVMGEVNGYDDFITDPSFDRQQVAKRGHAPWVMRSNLDEKTRMLSFALAENIWVSYQTEQGSLYKLWQGELIFEGAVYNTQHGPQPFSTGAAYLLPENNSPWSLIINEKSLPAKVQYLGHFYLDNRNKAGMRYKLSAGEHFAIVTEMPDVINKGKQNAFIRQFQVEQISDGVTVTIEQPDNTLTILDATSTFVEIMLDQAQIFASKEEQANVAKSDIEQGKTLISKSDCLSCHNEQQQVVGPSFAAIGEHYARSTNDKTMKQLTDSIINGSQGRWGQGSMTKHPQISTEDASAIISYIYSVKPANEKADVPLDENGIAYKSTRDYSVSEKLNSVHPSFEINNLLPEGFEPKVGGMDFLSDGTLVVASWDTDGGVFLVNKKEQKKLDRSGEWSVKRIAEGLQEPLGLTVVNERIFVLQKQEITELIDTNGDQIIDEYRVLTNAWQARANFHSFAFGMVHKDEHLYIALSICVIPGGGSCSDQNSNQGKVAKVSIETGEIEYIASGLRTPNGIGFGPNKDIFVTDNEGDWLPSSKLMHVTQDAFFGSRAVDFVGTKDKKIKPPVVWMPQHEIGNSPSEPMLMTEGQYNGQLVYGDVYHGGLKRVSLDKVAGEYQGAIIRFSAGFQGSVNRLVRGADGAIYVGEIGSNPNWAQEGKKWYGLERLNYTGKQTFELLSVQAQPHGFSLQLTKPLAKNAKITANTVKLKQWFYHPTKQYGGPKYNEHSLTADSVIVSEDGLTIDVRVSGLKAGYVVYIDLDNTLNSESGEKLWAHEAWYTLNNIPTSVQSKLQIQKKSDAIVNETIQAVNNSLSEQEKADGWQLMFDGKTLNGWKDYASDDQNKSENWSVENGTLKLTPSGNNFWKDAKWFLFGGASGDLLYYPEKFDNFELTLEWKISKNGNSGIFYFVADEEHSAPWETGLEMQVLDNEGHDDGQYEKHRSADLYDLIASSEEPVNEPEQWNKIIIKVQNHQVEHWMNGVKVVEFTHADSTWSKMVSASKFSSMDDFGKATKGHIVLQHHGDIVWYRNLKIRNLN